MTVKGIVSEFKRTFQSFSDFGFTWGVKLINIRVKRKIGRRDLRHQLDVEYSYLKKFLEPQIAQYNSHVFENTEPESKNVWVCWWQGEKSMPEWCRICYENLKCNIPEGYRLTLITQDNVNDYVDIPQHVYDRLSSKELTVTQFSDILREALLYYQGGLWIDSSVWTIPNFYKFIDTTKEFYSIKLGYIHRPYMLGQIVTSCMWSGFFMYGKKGCLVTKFAFEAMCAYYKEHVSTIDYFIQNIIIRIGYDNVPQIKALIDAYPINNTCLYKLPDIIYSNAIFNQSVYDEMTSNTGVFKISQKRKCLDEVDGQETYYGHFKNMYKDKM